MNEDLLVAKAELRRKLRLQAHAVSPAERSSASAEIGDRLRRQAEWQQARSLMVYAALPDELNVWPLAWEALADGRVLALPRFVNPRTGYEAAVVRHPTADLRPGLLGILEPRPDCAGLPLNQLDLILVPGLGFDDCGGRLGRGKGHYDRLLRKASGVLCGVAMDWQVLPAIPVGPHDRDLDCILTPTRWIACRRRAVRE
jgi:5-formyltetrahydrofolate cyclo-ligase